MARLFTLLLLVPSGAAAERVSFNRDIRPILADRCFACHGPDAAHRKGKLRLDTAAGAAAVLAAGKPDKSELLLRVNHADPRKRMPPAKLGKPVTAAEADLLRRWIQDGAAYEQHWSFAPLRRPVVPALEDGWSANPVDRFLFAAMTKAGVRPSPPADRPTLIRRVHLDLLGLPPAGADLTDARPDAYARLVERLLASPRHAERLAVYWLDLVRFADTVGYHGDQEHAIWPYRDWVIHALAANMPFDQFTRDQLAGDLLPGATEEQRVATGYNRVLQTTHEGGAQDGEYRAKYAADRVRNLSAVWLGATVGCAECHHHKFDPYTQKDFYRLAAFFADVQERGAYKGPDATPTKRPPELAVYSRLDRLEVDELRERIGRLDGPAKAAAQQRLKDLDGRRALTMVTVAVPPRPVRVLARGDWMDASGDLVEPGVPGSLPALATKGRATRLDLARWLTSRDQPQTARVFVNRLWYLFFGAGLSRNLEDTGSQGEWPTQPELLDFLACEFVESGWDVRHIIRLIVTSNAYQQCSAPREDLHQRDPENRLWARQAAVRLPAEAIRDQALAVSGLLVHQVGGPSVRPYQPAGYYQYLNFPKRDYKADRDAGQHRRGLYTHWQRQFLQPMLKAFDAPTREECTVQRAVSNTPLQALALLNDPSFVEAARAFAGRMLQQEGDGKRIRWAWRELLARDAGDREAAVVERVLREQRAYYRDRPDEARKLLRVGVTPLNARHDVAELAAWAAVARVLLNLDETLTRN